MTGGRRIRSVRAGVAAAPLEASSARRYLSMAMLVASASLFVASLVSAQTTQFYGLAGLARAAAVTGLFLLIFALESLASSRVLPTNYRRYAAALGRGALDAAIAITLWQTEIRA